MIRHTMPDDDRSVRRLLRVRPGDRVRLADVDPRDSHGYGSDHAEELLANDLVRLTELQERLWAEDRQRLLVVLQGIDTAGKGGTIKHVVGAFNPEGCDVVGFKVPTPVELAHDYLWRAHQRVPRNGEIVIFDRSHYEDILVVRVHDLVPRERWERRFRQINDWERLLVEEGTTVVKLFLYIDREEQRERLQARLDEPDKRWKFRMSDLDERRRWDDYIEAFEDMLERCSTDQAPWYVIPSSRKWFRNFAVGRILVETLEEMDPRYPASPDPIPDGLTVE